LTTPLAMIVRFLPGSGGSGDTAIERTLTGSVVWPAAGSVATLARAKQAARLTTVGPAPFSGGVRTVALENRLPLRCGSHPANKSEGEQWERRELDHGGRREGGRDSGAVSAQCGKLLTSSVDLKALQSARRRRARALSSACLSTSCSFRSSSLRLTYTPTISLATLGTRRSLLCLLP
jgi:hypothetical protein